MSFKSPNFTLSWGLIDDSVDLIDFTSCGVPGQSSAAALATTVAPKPNAIEQVKAIIRDFGNREFANYGVSSRATVSDVGWGSTETEVQVTIGSNKQGSFTNSSVGWALPNKMGLTKWLESSVQHYTQEAASPEYKEWFFSNGKTFRFFDLPAELRPGVYSHLVGDEVHPFARPHDCPHRPCNGHHFVLHDFQGALAASKRMYNEMLMHIRDVAVHRFYHISTLNTMTISSPVSIERLGLIDLALTFEEFALLDGEKGLHAKGASCPSAPRNCRRHDLSECRCVAAGKCRAVANHLCQGRLEELTFTMPSTFSDAKTDIDAHEEKLKLLSPVVASLMTKIPAKRYRIRGWKHADTAADLLSRLSIGLMDSVTLE